jgi:hypothetical protein
MSNEPKETDREIWNDIRSYLRITAAASSKVTALKLFDSWEKSIVYDRMDGKTSTYKLAQAVEVPQRTVATWADDFVRAGLAAPPDEFHPSHRALFALGQLSVDSTSLKKRKKPPTSGPPTETLDEQGSVKVQEGEQHG